MNNHGLRAARRRRTVRRGRLSLLVCLLALGVIGVAGAAAPPAVTDVNPTTNNVDPRFGGRVEALTVSPVDRQDVFAASELGGIFHSTNGGMSWSHVDAVSLFATHDVEFAPSDASLVIASGDYDGRVSSKGGIWRSTDGGATWANVDSTLGCVGEASAYKIAIAPTGSSGSIKVWVGTSCGIAYSSNSGQNWSHFSPSGLSGRVWDVQARDIAGPQVQVDLCGDNGYRRSVTGGATAGSFTQGTNPIPAGGFMPCSVATAPQDPNTVYMSFFAGLTPPPPPTFCVPRIVESTDGGQTWPTTEAPSESNCRNPWVVTQPDIQGDPNRFDVFIGSGVNMRHQRCDSTATPRCSPAAGDWPDILAGQHTDPTDIAFDTSIPNGCPILYSGDGGIFRTTVAPASCATSFGWADANVGQHGWDIRGFAGTVNPASTDLYFGTQDNGIYYTGDGGATYHNEGPDVYEVFADHNPPARVLWRHCFGCGFTISNPALAGQGGFSLPPGNDVPNGFLAAQFGHQSYAFMTHAAAPNTNQWTVYVTTNEGGNWAQMGPSPLPGAPSGPMAASGPAASPTFYLMLNTGPSGASEIWRLSGPFNNTASLTKATSGLSSPTTFAVDPGDPQLLYAYDFGGAGGRVMRSINGGQSWSQDTTATSMITHSNQFKLSSSLGPLVTSIAFDGNSDAIMLGTQTAGVLESPDNGASWFFIRGSEALPRLNGFVFDERIHAIYAATRGRGLWRINPPTGDLSITKSASPDPVIAGNELYYKIVVKNNGPDTASSITVTDTLPSQVTYVTSTNPSCAAVGQVVTCDVPDLASGDSYSFTIKVAVKTNAAAGGPTTIFNTASVSSDETLDTDTSNNSVTVPTIVEDLADLEVTKLCKPDTSPSAGEPINCTVFIDNNGPSDARGVVLTDRILGSAPFTISNIVASQGSCGAPSPVTGGQQFVCNLGVLPAMSTSEPGRATVTYTVSSNEGQDLNNKASVRSDTPDPDPSNNESIVTLTVQAVANLSLTKSAAPDPIVAGTGPLTWTLSIGNAGPSTAKNVIVTDTVPAGVVITSASGTNGASCTTGVPGDPFQPTTCNFGSLASGATRTMTIQATVLSGTKGTLENDARVSSDTFDSNNSDNLAHSLTTVVQSADLAIGLTSDPTPAQGYRPSSTIHYKVTVNNLGPSDADAVVVTVTLPPLKAGYYVKDDGGCSLSNVTLTCPIGTFVASGPTRTIFIDWFVQGNKGPVTTTANVASTANPPTPDPVPGNNTASVTVDKG